jgi:iron complex transport system permease protein
MPVTTVASGRDALQARPVRGRPTGLPVLVAVVVLGAVTVASLTLGARPLPWTTLVEAWTHYDPANGDHAVVASRIPRTLVGVLVGAALGLAGAAMQGIARNPLADPGILGVNAGAALGVVVAMFGLGLTALTSYIWFAFLGAGSAAVLGYAVASLGRDGATPVKLALAGAALTAGLASVMNGILVSSQETLDAFRFWQVGTVAGRTLEVIGPVMPFLAVGAVVTLGTGRVLNGLALGDDVARGLGQRVTLGRGVTALGVIVLCGASTALAGPIGFVGLVVPHVARAFVGGDYRRVLPLSALAGASLLVAADVLGRLVLPPAEVQAGVMTAVLGAPVFVWLVRRRKAVAL